MAESVHKALKSRFTPGRSYSTQSNSDIAIRSLEMMRINIQDEFDREINAIVKKYIDVSLSPSCENESNIFFLFINSINLFDRHSSSQL